MSLLMSLCAVLFPARYDVLDEICDLIGLVPEGLLSNFVNFIPGTYSNISKSVFVI